MPSVQFIFRKNNPIFFSIEKVFDTLFDEFRKHITVNTNYLPYHSSSINNIVKNIVAAKKNKADIFHVTGDIHYAVLAHPANKTILTVHDTVFLERSSGLKRQLFKWIFLKLPVRSCRYITTISEKSKDEIIRYTGCAPDKIMVIPNPIGNHVYYVEKEFNEHQPVLLFIGSTPNKNLERIVDALVGISCTLDIVGHLAEDQILHLKKNAISFRQFSNLSENEMAERYATCDIVIFPSLYEGFGLPIIEGQKAGRAVVTSNLSPMQEVAATGACLVDPLDVMSIRNGILKIIENSSYRKDLIQRGFENIQQYDTRKIAGQYLDLYKKILEQ